jgi:Na+-translocating ferredoxin:NAD+ oxidoreductase RnfC subunit
MTIVDQVRSAGVVGAGGGGFPTHVKLAAQADTVIANGAECEPLLHKDATILEEMAGQVVAGVQIAMQAVGAKTGIVGIKGKKKLAVEALRSACQGTPVRVHLLGDYYPAGDEYDLVHETTGRLIPPAGIPIQIGVVVNNVETFLNITAAVQGQPVTHKYLTIAGAVQQPVTLKTPIGTSLRACLDAAGGVTTADPVLCLGGLMMGEVTDNLDTPVTKTTTGVVVLPRQHPVIQRKLTSAKAKERIGKSACDQCRYCTEFCPRYLLGYAVEPHQVMRSLAFTATGASYWNQWAALCCACGLCTLYACPEGLYPKEACDQAKVDMRRAGQKWSGNMSVKSHALLADRRVPIKALAKKLAVLDYDVPAPFQKQALNPRQVVLPLKQGAGVPNRCLVQAGDRVKAGQPVGEIPPPAMGAILHAPFDGQVVSVTNDTLILSQKS